MKKSNVKNVAIIKKPYYVYMLECDGGVLYTGVSVDYKRRLKEHTNGKKGAKFTKSHKPLRIVALWITDSRSNAQKLESRIKSLSKEQKLKLIKNEIDYKSVIESGFYKRINDI